MLFTECNQGMNAMPFISKLCFIVLIIILSACNDKGVNDYLSSAKTYIESKNNNAAIIDLKNVIKLEPSQAEARFLLGKIYLIEKQYENAEKELNRALTNKYPAHKVIPLLSKAYQESGADNALIKLVHKQAGLTAAQAAEIAFYKLQALTNLAQKEKAKALITEIKQIKTDSPFKPLALVYALLLEDKIPAALLQLDNVLLKTPKQVDALKLKANLLIQQKKPELALVVIRQYLAYYPDDIEHSFVFAKLLTDLDQTEEAEPIIDRLLKINDQHMLLNQLKGVARFNAKDSKNALLYTEKAINSNPEDSALRLVAGVSAYLENNFQAANQHLSIIADKLPPSHEALRLLAASQLKLGLNLAANETLNQFDDITSQDTSLFSSVGLALLQSGEVTKAKAVLNKTPAAEQDVAALARLGLLQLSLNDVEGIINLESALRKITDSPTDESVITEQLPQQLSIERTLATAYIASQAYDKALALAERWKVTDPKNLQAYALAALVYVKQNNIEKAKIEFQQALIISPKDPASQMGLIQLNERFEPSINNQAALETILKSTPDFIPALVKLYLYEKQSSQAENRSNNAIKRIKNIVQQQPENIAIQMILAKMYLFEQRYTDTVSLLSNFENQENKPAPYWPVLGESYVKLKQFTLAKKHYAQWLAIKPNDSDAVVANILTMDAEKNYQEALLLAQQSLEKIGKNIKLLLLESYLLLMNNEFLLAQQSYDQLPENVLDFPFTKGVLGALQIHDKNYSTALGNLHEAYQAKPSPRYVRLMYFCYLKLDQKTDGQNFLVQHVNNNPQDQSSLMMLSNEQLQYDLEAAIENYRHAITLNENNAVAHNNLAYLYMEKGQLAGAQRHAEKAVELMPEDPNTLDTLAQISLKNNQNKKALTHLSKAVTLKNVNDEVYVNYIEALLLNSKLELAKRKITQREVIDKVMQKRIITLKEKYRL